VQKKDVNDTRSIGDKGGRLYFCLTNTGVRRGNEEARYKSQGKKGGGLKKNKALGNGASPGGREVTATMTEKRRGSR